MPSSELRTVRLIAVPGGWMIDDDENIYPTQAEAIAAQGE